MKFEHATGFRRADNVAPTIALHTRLSLHAVSSILFDEDTADERA